MGHKTNFEPLSQLSAERPHLAPAIFSRMLPQFCFTWMMRGRKQYFDASCYNPRLLGLYWESESKKLIKGLYEVPAGH